MWTGQRATNTSGVTPKYAYIRASDHDDSRAMRASELSVLMVQRTRRMHCWSQHWTRWHGS